MMHYFPSLGGYQKEPSAICDRLLIAVFASDYSQSNAFHGYVSSFQYIVQRCGQNFILMSTTLEGMFKDIFQRYFDLAVVTVRVRPMEQDSAKMVITLAATLSTDEGMEFDLQAQVLAADGLAVKILSGDREVWTRT